MSLISVIVGVIFIQRLIQRFLVYQLLLLRTTMCKKARASAGTAGNNEENVNVGLLNISSNSQSILSMETILEVLSFIILALLVIRWIRKCMMKRKLEQEQRLANIIQPTLNQRQPTSFIQEIPSAPGRAIMGPMGPMGQPPMTPQPQSCQEVYSPPIGIDKYR